MGRERFLAHRGFYHDAILIKRNNFNLLLHETFGGGFSPTAVLKLRRLARKVARGSVDGLLAQVLALFYVNKTYSKSTSQHLDAGVVDEPDIFCVAAHRRFEVQGGPRIKESMVLLKSDAPEIDQPATPKSPMLSYELSPRA